MLRVYKSKLWDAGIALKIGSHHLGVTKEINHTIHQKAVEQFGEVNIDVNYDFYAEDDGTFNCLSGAGLIGNFGLFSDLICIIIHWNEVKVTNEENRSTTVKDLFCKVNFINGVYTDMKFKRTTFTQKEWDSRYSHSHLHQIDYGNPLKWDNMCLGTGPIRDTIYSLRDSYQEETLSIFFWELDKVVHVESLRGIPYIRMESIGKSAGERADLRLHSVSGGKPLVDFMQSFFGAVKIPLGFENGVYVCGCTFLEFAIMVTNYLNKYMKIHPKIPFFCGIKRHFVLKDGAMYNHRACEHNYSWRDNTGTMEFKDRTYRLKIIQEENQAANVKELASPDFVKHIQRVYLSLVNIKFSKSNYGKEEDKQTKGREQSLHALCASRGICSTHSIQGASTEDSVLIL